MVTLQFVAPGESENVPAAQFEHVDTDSCVVPYFPATHCMQSDARVVPGVEVEPARHGAHSVAATVSEKVPLGQSVQSDARVAPGVEVEPAGHGAHSVAATVSEKVPLGQSVHGVTGEVSRSAWPAEQMLQLDAPGPEYDPTWHAEQYVMFVAPGVLENIPAAQFKQASIEVVGLGMSFTSQPAEASHMQHCASPAKSKEPPDPDTFPSISPPPIVPPHALRTSQ
jgi:hypothetical protein